MAGHNLLMAHEVTVKRPGWRKPILVGVAGVMLFVAGVFSRLTNPPSPLILSCVLGGLGSWGLWIYLKSGLRYREERLTGTLGEVARQRLQKQRPLSIALAIALIVLIVVPFGLSFFAASINPLFYNGLIGFCLVGIVVWSAAAAIGFSARHSVLDDHERTLANVDPDVR